MTQDARNSIYAWAATTFFVLVMWVDMRFDILPTLPTTWNNVIFGALVLLWTGQAVWWFWRRRGHNSKVNNG